LMNSQTVLQIAQVSTQTNSVYGVNSRIVVRASAASG
jgi:hypothetical protein